MSIEVYETMSTATMWLLLFVVAALALLIAALTKNEIHCAENQHHRHHGRAELCRV